MLASSIFTASITTTDCVIFNICMASPVMEASSSIFFPILMEFPSRLKEILSLIFPVLISISLSLHLQSGFLGGILPCRIIYEYVSIKISSTSQHEIIFTLQSIISMVYVISSGFITILCCSRSKYAITYLLIRFFSTKKFPEPSLNVNSNRLFFSNSSFDKEIIIEINLYVHGTYS